MRCQRYKPAHPSCQANGRLMEQPSTSHRDIKWPDDMCSFTEPVRACLCSAVPGGGPEVLQLRLHHRLRLRGTAQARGLWLPPLLQREVPRSMPLFWSCRTTRNSTWSIPASVIIIIINVDYHNHR